MLVNAVQANVLEVYSVKLGSGFDSPGKDADWHMKLLLTLWY